MTFFLQADDGIRALTVTGVQACALPIFAALLCVIAFLLAQAALTEPMPLIKIARITVANGTAVLSGSVAGRGTDQHLTVNGQPLKVDASGYFDGSVDLNGAGVLVFSLSSPGGDETNSFEVPLTGGLLGANGIVPPTVLDSVNQAGLSLLAPVSGGPNQPLEVGGRVADPSNLASLTVNGQDALGQL